MAEQIELRKERMLPELEQMKRIQLFDDTEIKYISSLSYYSLRLC